MQNTTSFPQLGLEQSSLPQLGISRTALVAAIMGLVLLSVGASRFPVGGIVGFLMGLVGYVMCLVFALALGEGRGTKGQRLVRIPLVVVGVLLLWVGIIAAAVAVATFLFARAHNSPYALAGEIVPAALCAVIAPALLTFRCRRWMGLSGWALGALWGFWLTFYPLTMLATVVAQPWGWSR